MIVIVEDECLVREMAADGLVDGDFEVLEAANADEALKLLEAWPDVRLVFTDVNMPGSIDGVGLAREVSCRWPHVQILVTSGHACPRPGELPKNAVFLQKPYTPSVLLETVVRMIGRPQRVPSPRAQELRGAPVVPAGLRLDRPHTGIGMVGALAEPLAEADE